MNNTDTVAVRIKGCQPRTTEVGIQHAKRIGWGKEIRKAYRSK